MSVFTPYLVVVVVDKEFLTTINLVDQDVFANDQKISSLASRLTVTFPLCCEENHISYDSHQKV